MSPISLRLVLGIVAAYVTDTGWSSLVNFFCLAGGFSNIKQLKEYGSEHYP